MLAFHNDVAIKEKYLARIRAHIEADEIIKGTYWEKGKGCAVGCTIHGANHGDYEIELGIPTMLAKIQDGIFEGLPNDRAKVWPSEFLEAIPVGAHLEEVWPKFVTWLLTDAAAYAYAAADDAAADGADAADAAAQQQIRVIQADKLLELLKQAT